MLFQLQQLKMPFFIWHISPWNGLQHTEITTALPGTLQRLRSAALKPHQKLFLLSTNIIPHFLHFTALTLPLLTTIRAADALIRSHIKDFLHLPACTPNGLLYSSKRDGGLGIPKLEILTTSIA
jgi:hypothetical protein